MERYDRIGHDYNLHRGADSRVLSTLKALLDLPSGSLLADIGAGTGNYANGMAAYGFTVKAIEPSKRMRDQSILRVGVEIIEGSAEAIPLEDSSVDGVFSTLAMHHFTSLTAAAKEMHRICPSGPIVLFTNDPRKGDPFWLAEYFPGIIQGLFSFYPPIDEIARLVASVGGWETSIHIFPLPSDFSDMNTRSGWNRPEIYLDLNVRRSMSMFALAPASEVRSGVELLRKDLDSGQWDDKYGYLRRRESLDLGFLFLKFQREEK